MEWTNQKVLELLDLYYKQPLLWNSSLKKQKDEEERNRMYENISAEIGYSPEILKSKMDSLKSQYVKEVAKEKHYRTLGSLYRSRWFAFDAMTRTKEGPDEDEKENKMIKSDVTDVNKISSKGDETSVSFSLHVTNELKNIKDPQIQALVKFKINRILFKAATGLYKDAIIEEQKKSDLKVHDDSEDECPIKK